MATILIACSPVDTPCTYAYYYWKRYARTPAQNGYQVVILKNASLPIFEQVLQKYNPRLVILNGHGGSKATEINNHVIVGVESYDPELGLKIYGTNTALLANRLVYLATCNCGKELAFRLIDAGAIAVLAYREPFIFLSEEHAVNPLKDKIALTRHNLFSEDIGINFYYCNNKNDILEYIKRTGFFPKTDIITEDGVMFLSSGFIIAGKNKNIESQNLFINKKKLSEYKNIKIEKQKEFDKE